MTHVRLLPPHSRPLLALATIVCLILSALPVVSQDTVTGAFEGTVTNSDTGEPIVGANALIINQQTGQTYPKVSDTRGRFYQGLLAPGVYTIRVSAPGYVTKEVQQRLFITRTGEVVPVPVALDPAPPAPPTPPAGTPAGTASPTPTPAGAPTLTAEETDIRARINASDARQGGAFTEEEVSTLPLGGRTVTRSFDELTLLLPGVAPPPQTLGSVAGPGVGAGVGSAGQFAVNGLRSRANNFTVDGSDNNDEDIGVRRQGFLALVPQPVESIREYQVITLLAPAQYGRNIGAQVNAVSKSGGNAHHGTVFGFFNSSQLNARNFFDSTGGNTRTRLQGLALDANNALTNRLVDVQVDFQPKFVTNEAGREDSFTLGQFGFVLGGPLNFGEGPPPRTPKLFYFVSAERQILNATKEANFAVPTVEQRGINNSGASGLVIDNGQGRAFPTSNQGDAIFSLFPFPNNPNGLYGRNTLTRVLPASGDGKILSGKIDSNFKAYDREHQFTARYNFTDDARIIPVTGGALFSSLRPRVQTQNFSTFLNSGLTGPGSASPVFNQLRLSYGRTRLAFGEVRDTEFLIPSSLFPNTPFLLNAPLVSNLTLPGDTFVDLATNPGRNIETGLNGRGSIAEGGLGPLGQVIIAGFSPVGVDVFNFPQKRVNNTYQVADTVTLALGRHSFAFGTDLRRTELNSDLPRNSRPLVTFNGSPLVTFDVNQTTGAPTNFRFSGFFAEPVFLAAASAASGFFQSQSRGNLGSNIGLRYYQLNFFGQDEWRARRNLSLSYGLRYEYNTPPREVNRIIERSFTSPALSLVPGLRNFIAGRTRIFDPDRQNFAPRVGIAYSPRLFGDKTTVIRAGYGIFYDQILGAVVSQSRNVFENFLTLNFAGGSPNQPTVFSGFNAFTLLNPALNLFNRGGFANGFCLSRAAITGVCLDFRPAVTAGTLNQSNTSFPLADLVRSVNSEFPGGFGFTLPARHLELPMAQQYSATFEQQLSRSVVVSVGYVGTHGRHLLRVTTPNLGPNTFIGPVFFDVPRNSAGAQTSLIPFIAGLTFGPGQRITPTGGATGGRPVPSAGSVTIYETSANSRYDSVQAQVRSRFGTSLQLQAGYTFSHARDDASDVFDLAGSPALPQDSLTRAGERADSNFDARHRFSYNAVYALPRFAGRGEFVRAVLGGLEFASTGQFQTGQPFTVNSVNDVNLDGNLTDRLRSTSGIIRTGDRQRPLRLQPGVDLTMLVAPIGQDGSVPRNSFRASNLLLFNLAAIKHFRVTESKEVLFRTEVFNLTNRANFGIPVRFLEAPGFGQATDTVTPGRRVQFALKFSF